MQFCADCNRCRFTRAELLGEKQLRIAGHESRVDKNAAAEASYPVCVEYLVHYDVIDGGWICTDCGHPFGSHPSAGSRDEASVSPGMRPITPPQAVSAPPLAKVDVVSLSAGVVAVPAALAAGCSPPTVEVREETRAESAPEAKARRASRRDKKGKRAGGGDDGDTLAAPVPHNPVSRAAAATAAPAVAEVAVSAAAPAAPDVPEPASTEKPKNAWTDRASAASPTDPPKGKVGGSNLASTPDAQPSKRALKRELEAKRTAKRDAARQERQKAEGSPATAAPVPDAVPPRDAPGKGRTAAVAAPPVDPKAPPAKPAAAPGAPAAEAEPSSQGPTASGKPKNAWHDREVAAASATAAQAKPAGAAAAEDRRAVEKVDTKPTLGSGASEPPPTAKRGTRKVQLAAKSELAPPAGEPLTPVPIAPDPPRPDHGRAGPPRACLADAFTFPNKERCAEWKRTPGGLEVQLLAESVQDSATSTATMILSLLPKGVDDPKRGAVFQFQAKSVVGVARSTATFRIVVGGWPAINVETDGEVTPAQRAVARTAIEPFALSEAVTLEALVKALPAEMNFWFDTDTKVTLDSVANEAIAEALW